MKVLLAALVATTLAAASAQDVSPNLSLSQFQGALANFSQIWLAELKDRNLSPAALDPIKLTLANDPAFAAVPLARTAALNIVNELAAAAASRGRTGVALGGSPVQPPGAESAGILSSRITTNWKSRLASAERTVSANLDLISRMAGTPNGAKFALLGNSPLCATLDQATMALSEAQQARDKVRAAYRLKIEITQVLDDGCLATTPTGDYDYKRIFVKGMTGGDIAEGQKGFIRATRDGVFKYTTTLGSSSTIEKWNFVSAD